MATFTFWRIHFKTVWVSSIVRNSDKGSLGIHNEPSASPRKTAVQPKECNHQQTTTMTHYYPMNIWEVEHGQQVFRESRRGSSGDRNQKELR
jgi:hypothetical protein